MNSKKHDNAGSFFHDKQDKVSPIRQTGFMIGHDFNSHHQQFELNEQDIRSTNEDSKITNLSTLSPQKNIEMKDEPQRKLESQPLYSSNNPLSSSSGDRLRKHRFGRPNTNSPFPNINNIRNHKNQQQQLLQNMPPPTAATSTKNQMQSEHVNTPSNQLEFNSSYGPSFIPSYNQSFLNSYNEVGSYYQQNIEEERYISQSFFQQQTLGEAAPSIMQIISQEYISNPQITKSTILQKKNNKLRDSFQKTPIKQVIPPSIPVYEQKTLNRGGGRAKIQSEPNSPKMRIFDSQVLQRPANGSKVIVTGGQGKVEGKDIQLRLSTNKMALFKNQYGVSGKHIKQAHQQKLKKKFANYSAEGIDIQGCLTPSSGDSSSKNKHKQQSFLPKLDRNNRDLNSQVLYIDLQNKNKNDIKERVDISCKSPTNNWIKDVPKDYRKISNVANSEKRMSNNKQDNQQIYTPSVTTVSNQYELSPEFIRNPKGLSHHFQSKNIGKMIPIHELKNIINEQVIRSKLNRGNQIHNENILSPGIMSEVVSPKNSPLSTRQIDTSRVIRGRVLINDPFINNSNKRMAQEVINEDNNITLSKFFQQRSGSQCSANQFDEADINPSDDKIYTQFHQRTNSVNQVQKSKGLSIHSINAHQQFNTIEEVMGNSKSMGKHNENSSARNEINQSNIHLPIKPIASKHMPNCFRMSKHQLKQNQKSYQHSFNHEMNKIGLSQQSNHASFLNEKRPSQIIDRYKVQSFSNMFVNAHHMNNARADLEVQSAVQIKSNGGYAQEYYKEKIIETEEDERARMTPAFNQRRKESSSFVQ